MLKKIVITGGHHTSALPVIALLKKEHPDVEIYWFGHKFTTVKDKNTTLEYREITDLEIPFYNLKAGKLYKTFNPLRLVKVPFGIIHALALLLKIKPDLILSFGGYLAAPTVLAGHYLKIPSITHEQTVVAGYANKFVAKYAKKVLVSWPQSASYFPKEKVVVSGLPLRKEIFTAISNNFDLNPDLPTIYITAGKTGSHIINSVIKNSLKGLLNLANIIHQTGDHSEFRDCDDLGSAYEQIRSTVSGKYYARKFVLADEIGEVFSKADLIISRAGAHITTEIMALNKPALLVPIPWVSHNEQFENAKAVKESGLAKILEENDLNKTTLLNVVKEMISNIAIYKLNETIKFPTEPPEKIIVDEIFKAL